MSERYAPAGGAFLSDEMQPEQVFLPEMLDAEARLMARTMEDFVRQEVTPCVERLEAHEEGLMRSLTQKAGALGLLGGGIPESYDGLGLSKTALALLSEKAAPYLSFAISIGIHSGVALLPLLFFGTPEQKQTYLPRLASGEIIGAFALSEAGSGSDALAAQTRATLAPDGQTYLLNGEKMWTTNGGFADVFIVFARVAGERFTAFVVERNTPGLSVGGEEHKMGLRGSSTCRLLLQNAAVPVANVVGEVGKGHLSALYALNVGRFSIAATALGASKECLRLAAQYAGQRVQFGQPIARFGLIQNKLAQMAMRIFLLESMLYRVAGYWDARIAQSNGDNAHQDATERFRLASEEYAMECALLKFFGTEVMAYVADEAVQIHGGFGFSEEFAVARMYRDARVFRIFEGTNEINRLTVLDQLLRRIEKGRLALWPPSALSSFDTGERNEGNSSRRSEQEAGKVSLPSDLGQTEVCVCHIRHALQTLLAHGQQHLGRQLGDNQPFAASIADMAAILFALESAWLRARALAELGNSATASAKLAVHAVTAYTEEAAMQAWHAARRTETALADKKPSAIGKEALADLCHYNNSDAAVHEEAVAHAVMERQGYIW